VTGAIHRGYYSVISANPVKFLTKMPQFLILLRPPREHFLETITEREKQITAEHFYYYKELLSEKKLFLAGRCDDATLGIGIITAENMKEAQKLADLDPAVMSGVFTATVKEFSISLLDREVSY
jgi:uncharacterized protein YciI